MSNYKSKCVQILIVATSLAFAAVNCVAQDTINIGIAMPIGGQNGAYVKRSFVAPTELAVKEINAAGGILGRQVKVTIEDTRFDGVGAVAALTKLIEVDKIMAVFTAFTPLTFAQLPIAEEKKASFENRVG